VQRRATADDEPLPKKQNASVAGPAFPCQCQAQWLGPFPPQSAFHPKPSAESVFGPCRPKSVMDMLYPKEPVVTLFTTPEER
jgi:hypothetical protein